ncbi:YcxB family protein [Anaerobacillus alkaliphilus]|uniref:YcxB family protein n=1 Tax=Anaerobacillus alkaliphilus TaxID=1548597 RepID=A0A4Q0VVE3_9BACI|nr:YcxB family protein [Anaerobacillus alkaliphilus]RXJ02453.1 YcxB family protein [Anaerobacillus alkaliphilus]
MVNKSITLEGQLTYEEFKQYSRYHSRKVLTRYFIIVFLVSIIGVYIMAYDELGWFLTISLPLSITYMGFITLKIVLNFFNKMHYDRNPTLKQRMKYMINAKSIRLTGNSLQSKYVWEDILSTTEYKDMFLLYVTKTSALILPKRYFKNKEDIVRFKGLLEEKINPKKLKLI